MISMLVTRPAPDNQETAGRLRALGIEPILLPVLSYAPVPALLPNPETLGGIILTSANAVRALKDMGVVEYYAQLPVFAVGDRTAHSARDAGFTGVSSAQGDAQALIDLLTVSDTDGVLFYPGALNQASNLQVVLAPKGIEVLPVPVYEMRMTDQVSGQRRELLRDNPCAAALFYSRRSAEAFLNLTNSGQIEIQRNEMGMLCLSANVAAPLIAARYPRIALADYPSEEAMMALALSFARDQIGS